MLVQTLSRAYARKEDQTMFRTTVDFLPAWEAETELTVKLLRELSDESLAQSIAPEHRSLGEIAWHLSTTIVEMMGQLGVAIEGPAEGDPVPASAEEILAAYIQTATEVSEEVQQWSDEDLDTALEIYGDSWRKGFLLTSLITHQAHHRGQMTVLMRQAGLQVPGIYGPSKEEWAEMDSAAAN